MPRRKPKPDGRRAERAERAQRAEDRPPALGVHFRADGTPKTSYPSRAEALVVADERRVEAGVVLNAYRCTVCSSWHLGHPEGRTST